MRWAALCLGLAGCDSHSPAAATVFFELDAPLCSSRLPVEFRIDGALVGTDTFRIHLPPDHIRSPGFPTVPGDHRLAAAIPGGWVWADTVVVLEPGEAYTRLLPFYCS